MRRVHLLVLTAAAFWFILFSPWTKQYVNFWIGMSLFSGSLAAYSLAFGGEKFKKIFEFKRSYLLIGIVSAAFLYSVFLVGNLAVKSLFDFAGREIEGIYSTKSQAEPYLIGTLLLLVIAPAEEIFWRGFIQKKYSDRLGKWKGFFLALALYSVVHVWSLNLILVGAAFTAGAFWGLMYMKYNSIVPGIISHGIWDLFIFILYPIS
ncbi:MAG: CPBP family intramembrane metalloprotease [Candidatus Marinimicrobia bacterium]|nr:CPBP family intramembrane metalloprotease [Candidatus Neomarinimicrobiota bacterium]